MSTLLNEEAEVDGENSGVKDEGTRVSGSSKKTMVAEKERGSGIKNLTRLGVNGEGVKVLCCPRSPWTITKLF